MYLNISIFLFVNFINKENNILKDVKNMLSLEGLKIVFLHCLIFKCVLTTYQKKNLEKYNPIILACGDYFQMHI